MSFSITHAPAVDFVLEFARGGELFEVLKEVRHATVLPEHSFHSICTVCNARFRAAVTSLDAAVREAYALLPSLERWRSPVLSSCPVRL